MVAVYIDYGMWLRRRCPAGDYRIQQELCPHECFVKKRCRIVLLDAGRERGREPILATATKMFATSRKSLKRCSALKGGNQANQGERQALRADGCR